MIELQDPADATPKYTSWPVIVALAAFGLMMVGLSYRFSAAGLSAQFYYVVFWLGLLSAVLPPAFRAIAWGVIRRDRILAVIVIALVTGFPKFLRNPDAPAYHDEYAHWRQAADVVLEGKLLMPNTLIPIVEHFPGTSAVTAMAYFLGHLTIWHSGILVVQFMHLAGILGVFVLTEAVFGRSRAGAIGAIVYAANPSAIYFSTQYAYESITINLFIWYLALGVLAVRATAARQRAGYMGLAYLFGALIIVTHHLTSVFLISSLGVISVVTMIWPRLRARRDHQAETHERRTWVLLFAGFVMTVIVWLGLVAEATVAYLQPYFGGSVEQLTAAATTSGDKAGTSRVVLAPSVQPIWERLMTAGAPVTLGLIAIVVVLAVWRERHRFDSTTIGLMTFGTLYFPSVLFILAPSGAEGARRSWGFSYVGIAVMIAFAVLNVRSTQRARVRMKWRPRLVAVGLVVLLIGNVGGGLNDPYRFPGPFLWGSDTRSASAEARQVGRALGHAAGQVRVVTDGYTALQIAAYGRLQVAAPSAGFPAWDLVQTDKDPDRTLAKNLTDSHFDYLVVDIRMAKYVAFNGTNFGPGDPLSGRKTPMKNLTRLDHVPWATRVMSTAHLRVYRLNFALMGQKLVSP